jgi:hypothetical protein
MWLQWEPFLAHTLDWGISEIYNVILGRGGVVCSSIKEGKFILVEIGGDVPCAITLTEKDMFADCARDIKVDL